MRERKKSTMTLWRTRSQDLKWRLGSASGRTTAILLALALAGAATWWQWPAITSTASRIVSSFQPAPPQYTPVSTDVEVDAEVAGASAMLRETLTRSVGSLDTLIATKTAAGVAVGDIVPASEVLASAQNVLERHLTYLPILRATADAVTTASATLDAKVPPPAPVPLPAPNPGGGGSSGGGTGGGGSSGGGSSNPPPKPAPKPPSSSLVSTSTSLTCNGGTVRVRFTGTGGGTVTVRVSGPASGSNSGSGSATAVVTGPGGTYTATATASGSVAISGGCG